MTEQLQLLMVEDSVTDAEIVVRHLKKTGHDFAVRRVDSEADMRAALAACQPDLIISDFSLPQFNGLRALEIAASATPHAPFIFVSGTIGEERAVDALRKGATDYVLKSNLARLSTAIDRALREAAAKATERESERQRCEQEVRLQRLTRTYRMLSSTSSAILRLRSRGDLLDEVCRIASRQGGYERVSISLVDANAMCLRPIAFAGVDSEALRAVETVSLDDDDMTLSKRALNSGRAETVNDMREGRPIGEREACVANDWRSCASLPLLVDGTVVGAMTLYSSQLDVFDEAELGVLLELTANVCFALQFFDKDEALQFLSYFDTLTGLAKRQVFCQRLSALSMGESPSYAVVVFDLQKLSAVNDSLGRYVGDRLLEEVAARIKSEYQDAQCAAYLGGGTFAIALPRSRPRELDFTVPTIEVAVTRLFAQPFVIAGEELRPAIRCGIAIYPRDAGTAELLLQNAEAALKAAREDNEKSVQYASIARRPTSRTLALEVRLNAALDKEEFLVHYQPKVDLSCGQIVGLEALLRWQDPQAGLVSPATFIPLLERSGAIVEVGDWVIRQAVRDSLHWVSEGALAVRVAVNVSALQLRRRDFVRGVLDHIEHLRPFGIDIEITESMLMQDLELSVRKLSQLREAGVGVAIDDFGTGYSSLRLLGRLPVDLLKVDGSFVHGIGDRPSATTLVETIVALARAFDMRTVAEGVETAEQLRSLKALGCDQAQGFYLSRPVPPTEVAALIRRLSPGQHSASDFSAGNL